MGILTEKMRSGKGVAEDCCILQISSGSSVSEKFGNSGQFLIGKRAGIC